MAKYEFDEWQIIDDEKKKKLEKNIIRRGQSYETETDTRKKKLVQNEQRKKKSK